MFGRHEGNHRKVPQFDRDVRVVSLLSDLG